MNKYIVFKIVIVILLIILVYNENKIKSNYDSLCAYLFPTPMTGLDRRLLKKGQERREISSSCRS